MHESISPRSQYLEVALDGLALALVSQLIGRVNLTPLDVAERDRSIRLILANNRWCTLTSLTRTSVIRVEPRHVTTLVPPNTESKDHTARHSLTHGLGGAEVHVACGTVGLAVWIVHPVEVGGDVVLDDVGVLDLLAVLDVEAAVFDQVALVVGGELSYDGEGTAGVDKHVVAVVVGVTDGVGVIAATVLVTDTVELTLGTVALEEAGLVAGVRSKVSGAGIGLPDVELVAARAVALEVRLFFMYQRIAKLRPRKSLTSPLMKGVVKH